MRSASAFFAAMTMPPVLRSMRLHRAGAKACSCSGPPLAVGVEICLNVIDQRFAVFRAVMRMHGLSGLFIDQQEIFVLIDDMQFRRGDGQISIFFFWGIKKLVVDV